MDARVRLRQAIDEQISRLRATVPTEREAALLCLLRHLEGRREAADAGTPDLITGVRHPALGAKFALWLCLNGTRRTPAPGPTGWAASLLDGCATLAAAEAVLDHIGTGYMRIAERGPGRLDAWVATKLPPARWRERADFGWWADHCAQRQETLLATVADLPQPERYRREARRRFATMAYQLPYPPDAPLGGAAVATWHALIEALIATALARAAAGDSVSVWTDMELAQTVGKVAGIAPAMAAGLLEQVTVDQDGIAWHAVGPAVAPPPLLRVGCDRVVLSSFGMLAEPLLFLARELRRRDPDGYHNAAAARETAFRGDLYALFGDRRYVTSRNRIVLRREDGRARTDIDAAIFDRKTGTLALFELKSQDAFARTAAELERQRDSFLEANRQVAGILDWVNRHGADEVLNRMDRATAKRFRVRRVVPFVLGRYLAAFPDGPRPDGRAAWGSWPQVLRLLEGSRGGTANPLGSLAVRLAADAPPLRPIADQPPQVLWVGETELTVWPAFTAYRDAGA